MNKSGIYKIECKEKVYIGSAINLNKRFNQHRSDLKLNKHTNIHLQNTFNKYGEQEFKFSVVEYCEPEKLLYYEQIWLDILWSSLDRCDIFNINPVAENRSGSKHSEETRKKLSESHKGKKQSKETVEKRVSKNKGKTRIGKFYLTNDKNEVILVENLVDFCKRYKITYSNMIVVLKGKRNHHKGWRLYHAP